MRSKFRWGIIGPGRIARKFAGAVHQLNGAEIYAIASRSAREPDQLRASFGAEVCYDSYEQLVSDNQIDAIYVATPHNFHYENVKLCMEAGKPVLCEKSFTVNARQAKELFGLSQQKGVFLMEALWTRFLPIYTEVQKWLDDGKIGNVVHVYSSYGFVADRDAEDRWLNRKLAGGTVLDLGVYNNALTQWATGQNPSRIAAAGHIGETGVDETIAVSYAYRDGMTAQYTATFEFAPQNELVIYGTTGRIIVNAVFVTGTEATLESGRKTKTIRKNHSINGFEYQIKAAMEAIKAGEIDCPQMRQADTLANMQTLDAIREQVGVRYPFE